MQLHFSKETLALWRMANYFSFYCTSDLIWSLIAREFENQLKQEPNLCGLSTLDAFHFALKTLIVYIIYGFTIETT